MGFNKVLVLAAHPDDAEFGAGGSINRIASEGAEIHIAVFSPCIESLPDSTPDDILFTEMERAVSHLGNFSRSIYKYNIPVRHFPENRQNILEELIILKSRINPELVILPSSYDVHQDHKTINQEGTRAFKNCNIIGYELPWNNLHFKHDLYIKLEERNINSKISSILEYKSQEGRYYADANFIRSLAVVRGKQVKSSYAEAFEVIRWLI